jgi:dCMP deaminase
VLVRDGRIIATGYNGTPRGFPRCNDEERGCHRCADKERYPSGASYDVCICVHAEQNALLQAARLGYSVDGAACYTTLRPCFGCLKELHQGGVATVRYLNAWEPAPGPLRDAYLDLLAMLARQGVRVEQLALAPERLDLRTSP